MRFESSSGRGGGAAARARARGCGSRASWRGLRAGHVCARGCRGVARARRALRIASMRGGYGCVYFNACDRVDGGDGDDDDDDGVTRRTGRRASRAVPRRGRVDSDRGMCGYKD